MEVAPALPSTKASSPRDSRKKAVRSTLAAHLAWASGFLKPGPESISFTPYLQDGELLEILGLLLPASTVMGANPLAGCRLDLLAEAFRNPEPHALRMAAYIKSRGGRLRPATSVRQRSVVEGKNARRNREALAPHDSSSWVPSSSKK